MKRAAGLLDVNLTARGSGTKWMNPSEGDGIDLTVYRQSQQQGRLRGSVESMVSGLEGLQRPFRLNVL